MLKKSVTLESRADGLVIHRTGNERLRILVLCSDDPQQEYLVRLLSKNFKEVIVLVESNKTQIDNLIRKKHHRDVAYRKFHSMRQKLTGRSRYRHSYFSSLPPDTSQDDIRSIPSLSSADALEIISQINSDITIVCGTSIIPQSIIDVSGVILNIHGGHLPDYRGNHCIFFAVYNHDFDKIGSTIHLVSSRLDAGAILDTIKIKPDISDNDEMLYCKALHAGINRLVDILTQMENTPGLELKLIPQNLHHVRPPYRHTDRTLSKELTLYLRRLSLRMRGSIT